MVKSLWMLSSHVLCLSPPPRSMSTTLVTRRVNTLRALSSDTIDATLKTLGVKVLSHHAPDDTQNDGYTRLVDLPDFFGPARLHKLARKKSRELPPAQLKGNAYKRALKDAARRLDAYASGVSVPLRDQLGDFRRHLNRLTPFESALAELTLASFTSKGNPSLGDVISEYETMRRAVVRSGKEAVAALATAATAKEVNELLEQGLDTVSETFEAEEEALLQLISTTQSLRRLPSVTPGEPLAVLVGMPNVGKSSIVTAISTGTPEINSYPFTTRGLKLGHVDVDEEHRYQVMDTPGVLARPDDERNPMEGLTLASVQLLPSAIIFVLDLSGTCGAQSSPELQLAVREQIRAQCVGRPWIDVRSKADLPLADGLTESSIPGGCIDVSVHEGRNVDALSREVTKFVRSLREQRLDE